MVILFSAKEAEMLFMVISLMQKAKKTGLISLVPEIFVLLKAMIVAFQGFQNFQKPEATKAVW